MVRERFGLCGDVIDDKYVSRACVSHSRGACTFLGSPTETQVDPVRIVFGEFRSLSANRHRFWCFYSEDQSESKFLMRSYLSALLLGSTVRNTLNWNWLNVPVLSKILLNRIFIT